MLPFTLATLRSLQGVQTATDVEGYYYSLQVLQLELHSTVRTLLNSWETSLPMLEELADHIISGKVGTVSRIEQVTVENHEYIQCRDIASH